MATFTITSTINIDALSVKAGQDIYSINGGYLTIDQDTRWGQNQNISASIGAISGSAALGGTVEVNSTLVRLIPYNGGSGNVPVYNTTISSGSASGLMIGVYSGSVLNTAPVETGSTMPATGFIKIKQWNSVEFASGALTGITASATGPSVEGWLEIVGVDVWGAIINRLNTFKVRGDYFKFLGVKTDGTRATTYQIPTAGSALRFGTGVEVQSVEVSILSASWSGGTGTYVVSSHPFTVGAELTVSGSTPSGYNVIDSIITSITTSTFSTLIASDPGNWTSSGTATVYEVYPCAGSKTAVAASIATDELRGKWCWISSAGLVRFGHDGSNSTGGFCPPAGRSIRVPNIFFECCTALTRSVNAIPNATLANRYEFITTGGGVIDMQKCCMNWYMNFAQAFSVNLSDVYTEGGIVVTECASPINWRKVVVGQSAATTLTPLTFNLNFAGGSMSNCCWTRAAQAGASTYLNSWSDCKNFTIYSDRNHSLTKAGNAAAGSYILTRVFDSEFNGSILGGGRVLLIGCNNLTFQNQKYYDNPALPTTSTIPMFAYDLTTAASSNITIDNLNWGILSNSMVQPYSGYMQLGVAGCYNITLRNLGTPNTPLDSGMNYTNATWSRVTTTMTITSTAHNLTVGNLVAVNVTSDAAAKAVTTTAATLWAITAVPSSDTFQVACTNTGQTSAQKLSYYPCMAGTLVTFVAAAAANNVKIQRCYVPHLRTGLLSGMDNSSKNIYLESVWGTEWGVQLMPLLNCYARNLQSTPALTAQTSVYGTHWLDFYTTAMPINTQSVSWTRTTTVAAVTSSAHGLRAGNQILVTQTSDIRAIINGVKTLVQNTAMAGPPNPHDIFSFACLAGGDTTGTISFIPLNGRVAIQMNEQTTETSGTAIVSAGTPNFTSAGTLSVPNINDEMLFETQNWIKGHKFFPITEVVMAGGTLTNHHITYSILTGTSWSSYKNLYYSRSGGGGVNNTYTATVTDTTGVGVGDYVWGTNIYPLAKVEQVLSSTELGLTLPNTGTVSGILRFNSLPSEPEIPSTGFKLRMKVKTNLANASPPSSIYFFTNSTSSTRAQNYPLNEYTLTLTGLENPTEVRVFDAANPTVEIAGEEDITSGEFSGLIDPDTYPEVIIAVLSLGYQNIRLTGIDMTGGDVTIPVQQQVDRQYLNP